jgi:hypothetical protein
MASTLEVAQPSGCAIFFNVKIFANLAKLALTFALIILASVIAILPHITNIRPK